MATIYDMLKAKGASLQVLELRLHAEQASPARAGRRGETDCPDCGGEKGRHAEGCTWTVASA